MSFKEQLKKDTSCFINSDEFAETHSINSKQVECVLMCADKDTDTNLQNKKGIVTAYKSIIVQSSLLEHGVPMPNDYLELDETLFKVCDSSEISGMAFIDLSKSIGKFDKYIVIQEPFIETINGFKNERWKDYCTCKAYIRHMNADDMLKLGTIVNNSTIFIKMPYKYGITSKMRVLYKDTTYEITSVDNIEEDDIFIDLICEASNVKTYRPSWGDKNFKFNGGQVFK